MRGGRERQTTVANDRRSVFRATAKLSLQEQLHVARHLESSSTTFLNTLNKVRATSKSHKAASRSNQLKYEWFQEDANLTKLEQDCSKDLESLLLRMHNEACSKSQLPGESQFIDDITDLLSLEQEYQQARVEQIQSHREQEIALKAYLAKVGSNQPIDGDDGNSQANESAQRLIFDAIVGNELVTSALNDQVSRAEEECAALRKIVIASESNSTSEECSRPSIEEFLSSVGGEDCTNHDLALEITASYTALCEELEADLKELKASLRTVSESATDMEGTKAWSKDEEEKFDTALKNTRQTLRPELLYRQLQAVLPARSLQQIKVHLKSYQGAKFYEEKKKDRRQEFQRRLEELKIEAKDKFHRDKELEQTKKRKCAEMKDMVGRCTQLRAKMDDLKAVKEAKERIAQQQKEMEELHARHLQEQQEESFKRQHTTKKRLVEDFRRRKLLDQIAIEKLEAEERERMEKEKEEEQAINAVRVTYRRQQFEHKVEQDVLLKHRQQESEATKRARLEALKQQTPYAETLANLTIDPERTRQETAAFRSNVSALEEGTPVHETGLFPSHGYDCDKLFKNAQFKLGIALRNAGISNSDYTRQAMDRIRRNDAGSYRHHPSQPTQLW